MLLRAATGGGSSLTNHVQVNNCKNKESKGAASHPLLIHRDYILESSTSWNCSHSLTLLQPDNTTVLLMLWKHQDIGLHCEPRLMQGEERENRKKP